MELSFKKITVIMATSLLTACMLTVGAITDSYITETFSVSAEDVIPEGYTPIYTFEDLYAVRNNLAGKYILMNDIDMTELTAPGGDWDINGTGWEPIGTESSGFSGVFDGNGHKIIGMNIHGDVQYEYVGLFGYSFRNAEIKNLGMVDCDIDITSDPVTKNNYIGTIIGYVSNSYKYNDMQGIVLATGEYKNCYSTGEIICTFTSERDAAGSINHIGGISGSYVDSDCYSSVNINVSNNTNRIINVGGIMGIESYPKRCYYTGNISYSSDENINAGAICPPLAIASTEGHYCYYLNGSCEGQESITGVCAGLSVAQMKSQSAFTNWDFENVWVIDSTSGYKYPQLRNCMQVPVTEMTITSLPEKTTYTQGDVLNLTGGKVSVYHEADESKGELDITESMLGAYDMSVIGKHSIPVNYLNCSTTFDIRVNPPAVANLEISSVTENSVSLSWDKVKGVNEYIIYGYNITEDTWTELGRSAKTNYTDSTVDLSTEYKYAVSACLSSSEDEFISEKSIVEKPVDMSEVQINIYDILMSDVIASETGYIVVAPEVYYDGKLLVEGTDYNITDGDFQVSKAGEYNLVLNGIGKFTGDVTVEFIVKCEHEWDEENDGIQCRVCKEYRYPIGDANCDGKVDFDDADYMAQTIVSGKADSLIASADFNQDDYIDILDAYLISCHVKGIEHDGYNCYPEATLNLTPAYPGEEVGVTVFIKEKYGYDELNVTCFDYTLEITDWLEITDEKNVITPITNLGDMTLYSYIDGQNVRFTGFVYNTPISDYCPIGTVMVKVPENTEPSGFDYVYKSGEINEGDFYNGLNYLDAYFSYDGGIQVISPIKPGDANEDGNINVRDAAFIASKLAQGRTDELTESADYNEDGKINVRDAAAIASMLASGR